MARVDVVDPYSGATVNVEGDSPQAKAWRRADAEAVVDGGPNESWEVADLVAYADEHDIDLGDATKKVDVLAAIFAAEDEDEDDTGDSAGDDN